MSGGSVELITFGCRLNAYESEVMARAAASAGLVDAVIVNTCAVTAEAERQARQAIRKARRSRPGARIIVTGCAAQIDPQRWAAMPEVDRVIGNREKLGVEGYEPGVPGARSGAAGAQMRDAFGHEKVRVQDIFAARETAAHLIGGFEGRVRAFVQVQNGCDHRCTFCIIPYGRGPSRSVALGPIVEQVRTLVSGGYKEIVLTGVDITAYGADLPGQPTLGDMVVRLLAAVPELPRLRLSSLDPVEIDQSLWRAIAEQPRLMPHLHLSLQAGDDLVLKRMKRRHLRADAVAVAGRARRARPDIVLGADLIAGFPTEDEAMARNSLALIADCGLTYLHVFPYSARPGTPAARMPQIAMKLRRERAARLRAAGENALAAYLRSRVGTVAGALVERAGFGRTEHYAPVSLPDAASPGEIVSVTIADASANRLIAAGAA